MTHQEQQLEKAKRYLENSVAPRAAEIDLHVQALRDALQGLCVLNLMALRRPDRYGGPGLSANQFREFQVECARRSGALAFLQTQHQSAVSMLSGAENENLAAEILPKTASGEVLIGIGFSQLRRPGEPVLKAERRPGGYRLSGSIPWVTGKGFFHQVLVGASCSDGRSVFGLVPFEDSQEGEGELSFGEPMQVAAMQTVQTVSCEVRDWWLADEKIAFHRPDGWIHRADRSNVAVQGHFAMGCARAGIDVLERAAERRDSLLARQAVGIFLEELEACRKATESVDEENVTEALGVRAWAIELAVRCAHAGVVATGGSAISLRHAAQRVFREALVYSVSAQTTAIMEATLKRLARRTKD